MEIKTVEKKFRRIQEKSVQNGAENGLTANEQELLGKLINLCGEVNIAGDVILRRCLP